MNEVDIPSLPLESFEVPDIKDETVQNEVNGACVYAFVGSGQAGCRMATAFYDVGYKKTIALNTAKQDLEPVPLPPNQKYLMNIGQHGAGKDMQKGESAALKYQQEIFDMMKRIFGRCDHIILCIGCGGGCVSSDSLVYTDRFGLTSIEELFKKVVDNLSRNDVPVITENGDIIINSPLLKTVSMDPNTGEVQLKDITALWSLNKNDSGVRITTSRRQKCTTSPEHPYFILDIHNKKFVERRADQVKAGDIICDIGDASDLVFGKYYLEVAGHKLDEELAWFSGIMAGDGHIDKSGYCVTFRSMDEELLAGVKHILESRFNGQVTIKSRKESRAKVLRCWKRDAHDFLKEMLVIAGGKKSNYMSISNVLTKSPKSVVSAFISGFIDADGWNCGSSVCFHSTSKVFVDKMMALLSLLGVASKVRTRTYKNVLWKTGYEVRILINTSGDGFNKYILPFIRCERKQTPHNNSNMDIIPIMWSHLSDIIDPLCFLDSQIGHFGKLGTTNKIGTVKIVEFKRAATLLSRVQFKKLLQACRERYLDILVYKKDLKWLMSVCGYSNKKQLSVAMCRGINHVAYAFSHGHRKLKHQAVWQQGIYDFLTNKYQQHITSLAFVSAGTKLKLLLGVCDQITSVRSVENVSGIKFYDMSIKDNKNYAVANGGGMMIAHNTGAGSVFVLIEVAKKYMTHLGVANPDQHVGVIAALPTDGELQSSQVKDNTKRVGSELCRDAIIRKISPFIIVDNSKIEKLYRGLPPAKFWSTINGTIAGLFDIFNRLAIQDSQFTSFDSADYKSIMECHGCMILGVTGVKEVKDETTISQALKSNLEKTLLADGFDLSTATHAGVVIVADQQTMDTAGMMDKFNYGFDVISNLVGKSTVHRGIYQANKPGIKVYTVIGGLDAPRKKLVELGANVKEIWPEEHK